MVSWSCLASEGSAYVSLLAPPTPAPLTVTAIEPSLNPHDATDAAWETTSRMLAQCVKNSISTMWLNLGRNYFWRNVFQSAHAIVSSHQHLPTKILVLYIYCQEHDDDDACLYKLHYSGFSVHSIVIGS